MSPIRFNIQPWKNYIISLGCIGLLIGSGTLRDARANDWPSWLGPQNDGIAKETDWMKDWPKSGPDVLWRARIGTGFSSMATSDGMLYAMGHESGKDILRCLDMKSGDLVWTYEYPEELFDRQHEGGPGATPTIDDGTVYIFSKNGKFHAVDAKSGKIVWRKNLVDDLGAEVPTWGFSGSAVVEGNKVLLDAGFIIAFDKKTGEVIWKTQDYGSAYATPVVFEKDGKKLVAAFPEYGLVVLQLDDGSEVDKYRWETSYGVNATMPIVSDNFIFISSGYNKGAALLKLEDGQLKEQYTTKRMRNRFSNAILYNGHIYGIDDKILRCLDFKTGEQKWEQRGFGEGTVLIVDDKLFVLSERGELIMAEASPEGFNEIARTHQIGGKCWTVPIMSNKKLFMRNARGDLVCLDLSKS